MYSFRGHLTEAFSASKMDEVARMVGNVLSRRVGAELHRFGGPNGLLRYIKSNAGKGTGLLYFIGSSPRAIRFNYEPSRAGKSFRITSIDYWSSWEPAKTADVTSGKLSQDVNINTVLDIAERMITEPVLGKALREETNLQERRGGKRVSPQEFARLAFQEFGQYNLKLKDIEAVAANNEVQVPTKVRHMNKKTRGVFDLDSFVDDDDTGDESDEFRKGEPEKIVQSPEVDKAEKSAQQIKADTEELFEDLIEATKVVAKGFVNGLIVSGGPGTGKTYTVTKTLKDQGLVEEKDWVQISGRASTMGIYQALFMNRDSLVLFDDSDDALKNDDSANIIKAAADTTGDRRVSWNSNVVQDVSKLGPADRAELFHKLDMAASGFIPDAKLGSGEYKLPNRFDFNGQIIFISNIPKKKMNSAIISRSIVIDVDLTARQTFYRIESVMHNIMPDVELDQKHEVLDYLKEGYEEGDINHPSIRTFVNALAVRASGSPAWRRLVKHFD